ncbi:hypothetical protein WJU23_05195 [Prosthecobacter sp. SYSU 5D2]|uniref:hypothetical protein n=1 Tax=Prosthecobacter sp. SYSU 5D2 TaxID=3134134 RepID=UPI0031FEA3EC
MASILGIASLLIGAVGTGLSYASSVSAAKTQDKIAGVNAANQVLAINQQRETAGMQSRINQQMAANERAALERNAVALEDQAEAVSAANRENTRRTRQDYQRFLATQRAQIGASGVSDATGSPLSLLSATAEEEQRAADEIRFQDEGQRRSLFREADNQRIAGDMAKMQITGYQIQAGAARQAASTALAQSRLDLMSANAASNGMRNQAIGGLFSSVGGLTGQAYDMYRRTPRGSAFAIA